jgi:hypothetical protein
MIRTFNPNLYHFRFAPGCGFKNSVDRSGQGGAHFFIHHLLWASGRSIAAGFNLLAGLDVHSVAIGPAGRRFSKARHATYRRRWKGSEADSVPGDPTAIKSPKTAHLAPPDMHRALERPSLSIRENPSWDRVRRERRRYKATRVVRQSNFQTPGLPSST